MRLNVIALDNIVKRQGTHCINICHDQLNSVKHIVSFNKAPYNSSTRASTFKAARTQTAVLSAARCDACSLPNGGSTPAEHFYHCTGHTLCHIHLSISFDFTKVVLNVLYPKVVLCTVVFLI